MSYISISKPRTQRTYEGVWLRLKNPPHMLVLEIVDPLLLPRIKRMVSKEKDTDNGFKAMSQESYKLVYVWNEKTRELRIELQLRYDLMSLSSTRS